MLNTMRRYARSWVVKVLLGVLVVSFAVWGIGDVFRAGSTSNAATVDGLEISAEQLESEIERNTELLRQRLGQPIDRRQAIALGVLSDSLTGLVARRLVDRHGADLGLGVADAEIAQTIRDNPLFQGATGFDRARYDLFLRSQNESEAAFVEDVRDEIRRSRLIDALTEAAVAPERLARLVSAYRDERRTAERLTVLAASMPVEAPDDAALEDYLKAHQAAFKAPERRGFELLLATPERLEDTIEVSQADVEATYAARKGSLGAPERREVAQVRADSEAAAAAIRDETAAGTPLEEAAEAADATFDRLGPLARDALPGALGEAVFALAPGDLSRPVQSPFGWHVFELLDVEPASTPPLAEVEPTIKDALRRDRAIDAVHDVADQLNDEIAAGSTLEEAAANLGLDLTRIKGVDRAGLDAEGKPTNLPPEVLTEAFAAARDEVSLLGETGDGYFMLKVTDVTPERDLTLAEAQDTVLTAWTKDAKAKAAAAKAAEFLQRANEGVTLVALAGNEGDAARLDTAGPLGRNDTATLPRPALEALFATPEGRYADKPVPVPGGTAVLRTAEVIPAPADAPVEGLRSELLPALRTDLLVQYEAALRDRYPVEVNERLVADLLGGTGS